MWHTGLVARQHVGSSQTRARTRVPCIGRGILNHCTTREGLEGGFLTTAPPGKSLSNFQNDSRVPFPRSVTTAEFLGRPIHTHCLQCLSSHSFLNLLHSSLLPYLFTEIALDKFTENLHMAKPRDIASVLSTSHRYWTQVSAPSCLTPFSCTSSYQCP